MKSFIDRPWSFVGLCIFGVAFAGCGDGSNAIPVAGKVTLDGQPLSTGTVTFHADASQGNSEGGIAAAVIDAQGQYEMLASPGWYKVTVMAEKPRPEDGPEAYAEPEYLVPEQYISVDKTPLSLEVKTGGSASEFDLELTN